MGAAANVWELQVRIWLTKIPIDGKQLNNQTSKRKKIQLWPKALFFKELVVYHIFVLLDFLYNLKMQFTNRLFSKGNH